jgi:hypothetical protein
MLLHQRLLGENWISSPKYIPKGQPISSFLNNNGKKINNAQE